MTALAAKPSPALSELIAPLSALHPTQIDLSPDRMHRLLERLDHPAADPHCEDDAAQELASSVISKEIRHAPRNSAS